MANRPLGPLRHLIDNTLQMAATPWRVLHTAPLCHFAQPIVRTAVDVLRNKTHRLGYRRVQVAALQPLAILDAHDHSCYAPNTMRLVTGTQACAERVCNLCSYGKERERQSYCNLLVQWRHHTNSR